MNKMQTTLLRAMRSMTERHIALAVKNGEVDPQAMMNDVLELMMRGEGRLPALALRFMAEPDDMLYAREQGQPYFETTGDLLTPALLAALKRPDLSAPVISGEVRPYTFDEQINILASYVQKLSAYWKDLPEDESVVLSGMLHSFLSLMDGNNGQWPGMLVSSKHAFSQDFSADFGGHLHERLYHNWTP